MQWFEAITGNPVGASSPLRGVQRCLPRYRAHTEPDCSSKDSGGGQGEGPCGYQLTPQQGSHTAPASPPGTQDQSSAAMACSSSSASQLRMFIGMF